MFLEEFVLVLLDYDVDDVDGFMAVGKTVRPTRSKVIGSSFWDAVATSDLLQVVISRPWRTLADVISDTIES